MDARNDENRSDTEGPLVIRIPRLSLKRIRNPDPKRLKIVVKIPNRPNRPKKRPKKITSQRTGSGKVGLRTGVCAKHSRPLIKLNSNNIICNRTIAFDASLPKERQLIPLKRENSARTVSLWIARCPETTTRVFAAFDAAENLDMGIPKRVTMALVTAKGLSGAERRGCYGVYDGKRTVWFDDSANKMVPFATD